MDIAQIVHSIIYIEGFLANVYSFKLDEDQLHMRLLQNLKLINYKINNT